MSRGFIRSEIAKLGSEKFAEVMPVTSVLYEQCNRTREYYAQDMNTAFEVGFLAALDWFMDETKSDLKIDIVKSRFPKSENVVFDE